MAITFSNGFGIGASNNGGGGSLSFFTNLNNITTTLRNYMSEFKNPDFYEYLLDGETPFYIYDGDGDMYDSGNATSPWLISNVPQTGTSTYNLSRYPYAIDYSTVGNPGTMDTSFGYLSLGYAGNTYLPLTVIGTRATIANPGDPIGFQVGGNIGADGSGTHVDGNIYTGDTVNGFTVHAFYSETYDAGDPSVCDVFILLGHPSWNSVFGNVYYGADNSNDGNSSFLYTSGNGATNILAIKTLLSKYTGNGEITFSEVQTVVDNFIARIGETLGNAPTPTPTPTMDPTPTPSPLPLSQFTPNGTPGSNGLITYLDYTTGINASNLLPDQTASNNEFAYSGANPYTSGVTGYTFTGSGSYAYAVRGTNYNAGYNQMSFEMWVKIPTIQSSMSLIAAGGNNSGGWALRVDSGGNALNLVKYNVADQSVSLPSTLQANTWYHIAVLQGGTSLTFMINGVIVGAVNNGATNNFSFPSGTINIAKDYYTDTNYAMSLGQLKVYDYCLTSSDVVADFNDTKAGYGFAVDPTPTPTPTPTDTSMFVSTCYTVRQYLYGYTGQSSNGGLYVLASDYPDAATIPVGATTTINGIGATVTYVSSSNSGYFNGGSGYIIDLNVSVGNITAGDSIEFCWMAPPTPTPTPSSTSAVTPTPTPSGTSAVTPTPTPTTSSSVAPSGFTVNIYESGSDVVMSASGVLDISSLSLITANAGPNGGGGLGINSGTFLMGAVGAYFDEYSGLTSTPSNFGTGGGLGSTTGSGGVIGVIMQGAPPYHLMVPAGYTSGTQISSTQTFTGQTFTSLGLVQGTYTFTWGSDSMNVLVGTQPSVTPTPTPSIGSSNVGYNFYVAFGDTLTIPPVSNGQTIFYTTAGGPPVAKNSPNNDGTTYLMFYKIASDGTSYETQFSNLMATGGTINVTQNGQTATYTSSTPGAFHLDNGGFLVFSAALQTATVTNPFTYSDKVTITFS